MRERIANRQITKEIKGQLPVIDPERFAERACNFCPYYAGSFEKRPRCMMADCAWDDEGEHFHPLLRQMLPEFKSRMEKAEEKYREQKAAYELLLGMFEDELAQEELEEDECYNCCYGKCGPCIGLCYKELTARKEGVGR